MCVETVQLALENFLPHLIPWRIPCRKAGLLKEFIHFGFACSGLLPLVQNLRSCCPNSAFIVENDRVRRILENDVRGLSLVGSGLVGDLWACIDKLAVAARLRVKLPAMLSVAMAEIDADLAAALERLHVRIHLTIGSRAGETVGSSVCELSHEVF